MLPVQVEGLYCKCGKTKSLKQHVRVFREKEKTIKGTSNNYLITLGSILEI